MKPQTDPQPIVVTSIPGVAETTTSRPTTPGPSIPGIAKGEAEMDEVNRQLRQLLNQTPTQFKSGQDLENFIKEIVFKTFRVGCSDYADFMKGMCKY